MGGITEWPSSTWYMVAGIIDDWSPSSHSRKTHQPADGVENTLQSSKLAYVVGGHKKTVASIAWPLL